MKYKKIFIFLLCFSVSSCVIKNNRFTESDIETVKIEESQTINSSNKHTIIDLNNGVGYNSIEQGDLLDTITFLPLETNRECVLGCISKLIIGGDRIFILDEEDRFMIFDLDGHFVNKITKGNGPGEVNKVWDFSYSRHEEQLIIYQSDYLNFYDKNGSYIKSKKCPIMFKEFCATDWGYVLYQDAFLNYHLGELANNSILITDTSFAMLTRGGETCNENIVCGPSNISVVDDKIVVSPILSDTIYEITDPYNIIKYTIDYHTQKIDRVKEYAKSTKFYHTGTLLENSKTQIFHFWSGEKGLCTTIRDKTTDKVIGGTTIKNNENEMPLFLLSTLTVFNDFFVAYNMPYNNMEYNSSKISTIENGKLARVTEEDNAVLIFYKIKTINE